MDRHARHQGLAPPRQTGSPYRIARFVHRVPSYVFPAQGRRVAGLVGCEQASVVVRVVAET